MQALHELMRVSVNIDLAYIMITCSASHLSTLIATAVHAIDEPMDCITLLR